jgi:predicted phosphohydrolase
MAQSMKIRYFSDLHLEFIKAKDIDRFLRQIPPGPNEVCILAGDIGNPFDGKYDTFMKFISQNFMKTFVISGNHEYYGRPMETTREHMKTYFERFEKIRFLDNSCEMYGGYCFVGTTLWTHVSNPQYKINDLYSIPKMDVPEYNRLHSECAAFLEEALQQENCVVITHHMPSRSLIHEKYLTQRMLPYNQWFACDLDHLFRPNIKAWFYGHTHTPSEDRIQDIPFLCNPIGYPGENAGIDFGKSIEMDIVLDK